MSALLLWLFVSLGMASPPTNLSVVSPPHNDGLNLSLTWTPSAEDGGRIAGYTVLRGDARDGPYVVAASALPAGTTTFTDKVTTDARKNPPKASYWYRVVALEASAPIFIPEDGDGAVEESQRYAAGIIGSQAATPAVEGVPDAALVNTSLGYMVLLGMIVAVGGLMIHFARQAQQGKEIFIRRIPGIDAIEEGIGRATEMGKPVLYVPGIDELQDIQTIASMLILGQVSKMVAEYQSDIVVSCCIPIVREVADEVVKAGFFQAGHPDAYIPGNTRFISSEQFAFTAGTNGIILREKPATNLYLGRFFAESLILAETGYVNKSIQIAGTAEATQLPFFVAACDYTLIGEELFAVSAYLSKDPRLVSSLKASDYIKVFVVIALIVGTIATSLGSDFVVQMFTIFGGWMRRTLPLIITFVVGLFMIGEFFIPHYRYRLVTAELLEWGVVLAAAAFVLGLFNLVQVNLPKVVRREKDWPYKLVMLVSLVVTLVVGFYGGSSRQEAGQVYKWVYDFLFIPLNATMFALLAFYIASAAFRAFRARNIDAAILLLAAIIVMLARVPLGENLPFVGEYLTQFMNWIMDVPNIAARRAIFIGSALGAVATGLRVILGIERSHLGGEG